MTEVLIREQVELQKRAAERDEWEKLARFRESLARLETRFDAQIERFNEAQGRAVSQDDLKAIRREAAEIKRDLTAEIQKEVASMHTEIEKSNQAWAEKILNGARTLNAEAQVQRMEEQKHFGRQIAMTVFAAVLSIIGALFVFWMTSGRP